MIDHFWQSIDGNFTFPDFYAWAVGELPDHAKVVEVGVKNGQSAAFLGVELMNRRPNAVMHLVDISLDQTAVVKALAPVAPVVGRMVRAPSVEVARQFADATFDMVYIDADHTYENVRDDIHAWLPKVKPGGMLAGHDFTPDMPGVFQAVMERFSYCRLFRGIPFGPEKRFFPTWMVKT